MILDSAEAERGVEPAAGCGYGGEGFVRLDGGNTDQGDSEVVFGVDKDGVGVGAIVEQSLDRFEVVLIDREEEWGLTVVVGIIDLGTHADEEVDYLGVLSVDSGQGEQKIVKLLLVCRARELGGCLLGDLGYGGRVAFFKVSDQCGECFVSGWFGGGEGRSG